MVPVSDTAEDDLLSEFPECIRYISDAIENGGGVLVHWYLFRDQLSTDIPALPVDRGVLQLF